MRLARIAVIALLGIVMMSGVACGGGNTVGGNGNPTPTLQYCYNTEYYDCLQTQEYTCYETEYYTEQVPYQETQTVSLTYSTSGFLAEEGWNAALGCYAGQHLTIENTDSVSGSFTLHFSCQYGGSWHQINQQVSLSPRQEYSYHAKFDIECEEAWTYSTPTVTPGTKQISVTKYRTEQKSRQVPSTCTQEGWGTCEREVWGICQNTNAATPTVVPTQTRYATPTPTYSQCSTGSSPAVNDHTKCCPTGYPYYWSSDGKCHTTSGTASTPTPTSNTLWRENIRSGDIVLAPTRAQGFGHVGICYGTGIVVEALGSGVELTPIEEWDDTAGVYVLRVDCSDEVAAAAASLAATQEGKAYQDWYAYLEKSSDMNSSYWYCSELVWGVYMNLGIDLEYTPDNYAISPWEIYMSTRTQVIYHHSPPDILHPDETYLWDSVDLLDFSYWAE